MTLELPKRNCIARFLTLVFLIAAAAGITLGQTNSFSIGSLNGTVLDLNGRAVPGAAVEIVELGRKTVSDAIGVYRFENLAAGDYTVSIAATGFTTFTSQPITISGGQAVTNDIAFAEVRRSINQVDVIGTDRDAIAEIPGSVAVVSANELRSSNPIDANEVLRRVTGVHVREDSGPVSLRLNMGIRGLNPDRSRQILVLEDGIPLSLAPYGEPELYYSPPIDRMQRVEILKGSGSILYGPQTIGGVVNFVTPDPPERPTGTFQLTGGERDYLNLLTSYGGKIGKFGGYGSLLRKQGNGFRSFDFGVTDFTSKFNYTFSDRHIIGAKLSLFDETSNSTYLGLTQAEFERDPTQNPVPDDRLDVQRYLGSVNYQFIPNETTLINTTAYAYHTKRNWRRQDFDRAPVAGRAYLGVFGDEDVPGGAVFLRDSSGNRNRDFNIIGIESRLAKEYSLGGNRSTFTGGVSYVFEEAYDAYVVGETATSSDGILRDAETRPAHGASVFAQNRFTIGRKFTITPGIRFENYSYERRITRARVGGIPTDVDVRGKDSVSAWIPGVGVAYQPVAQFTIFAGVHRGFAPPRVKDAVNSTGTPVELDAEFSWNYEAGARYAAHNGFNAEATFYTLQFENQIIPASQSGGATSTLINAGKTLHQGFELQAGFDFGKLLEIGHRLTTDLRYSNLAIARFENGIYDSNRLPYAPEDLFSFIAGYRHPNGFGGQYDVTFVGRQFADNNETVAPNANGEIGLIPSYTLHNVSFDYERTFEKFSISPFVTVKNLTNRVYISSRAPQGIQPGLFRQANVGIRVRF
ncbi:MAG: TonB-dependent receptor [Blastocatellia bacterium]|nr:TonB-dependent receptor [Blastocatellia bacterium]